MAYSPLFDVLYDETKPTGNIGRGTHYSILRTLVAPPGAADDRTWKRTPLMQHTFALIWDEDHDERIIRLLERLHVHQLLAPIRFIGERKGGLNVLFDAATVKLWMPGAPTSSYAERVAHFADHNEDDAWAGNVYPLSSNEGLGYLVQDGQDRVRTYLNNIENLWSLGPAAWVQPPLPLENEPA